MPLPNFFVIGASKSGTTALWKALSQHPDVYISPVKEARFFAVGGDDPIYTRDDDRGYPASREYRALFAGAHRERASGESSGVYLTSSVAAQRIRRNVPDAKLVALLRQPIE